MPQRCRVAFRVSVCTAVSLLAVATSAQSTNVSNEVLLRRIEELERRLAIAERRDEIDREASAEKAKSAVTVSAGASGLQVNSADTNFVLKVRGYIQADSRWYINDETAVNDTFLMRRVRPTFEGTVWKIFDYRLMLDFGSGVTSSSSNDAYLQDAYITARLWPAFQIQAGKMKEPVGLERLQSGANLLFVERAYPTQLVPNRDVGVQLQGDLFSGALTYQIGAFNGVQDGATADIDASDDEKDVAGRVFAQPFINSEHELLRGLGLGVAGTYGDHEGAPRGFTSPGQQAIFAYYTGTGTNAVTVSDGVQWRLVPQAYYYWRSVGLLAEYAISSPELRRSGGGVPVTRDSLEHHAWQVAASYFLTGEDNAYRAVAPLHPLTLGGEGWGAFEVTARISELRLDRQTFPLFANPATSARKAFSYAAGLNWYLNRNVRVYLDYEHTDFEGGSSNQVLQQDENVILTRAQLSF